VPSASSEVLVLGAGIVGCALAYHLGRKGVRSVTVYDPRTPAAGATGRAAGVVTEQLWNRWDVEVTRESHREYATLCARWDPEAYLQNGFVRWTSHPDAVAAVEEARERLKGWGVAVEEASPSDLKRWLPAGRFDDVRAAIFSPHDACVTPSSVTTIYAEAARQGGASFDFGRPMLSVGHTAAGWQVKTPTGDILARTLVVAAGAWSKTLLRSLGHPIPLTPYRTQAALLRPSRPALETFPTLHDIDLDIYVRPEAQGRLLGGDGTEKVEADPERFIPGGDSQFLEHLAVSLGDRLPGWADSEVVSAWAGVCTSTFDRRPIIGVLARNPDLFVATGFNGFGVMRAGGVARRLADLIAEGPEANAPREALLPVAPDRFPASLGAFAPRPGFTLEGGDAPRF
jgi:sarcosine oxidase subunit beta